MVAGASCDHAQVRLGVRTVGRDVRVSRGHRSRALGRTVKEGKARVLRETVQAASVLHEGLEALQRHTSRAHSGAYALGQLGRALTTAQTADQRTLNIRTMPLSLPLALELLGSSGIALTTEQRVRGRLRRSVTLLSGPPSQTALASAYGLTCALVLVSANLSLCACRVLMGCPVQSRCIRTGVARRTARDMSAVCSVLLLGMCAKRVAQAASTCG